MLSKRFLFDQKPNMKINSVQENAIFHFNIWNKGSFYQEYDCDCGEKKEHLEIIAEKDRYGLKVRTCLCKKCGLVMTNPRMDTEANAYFYDKLYNPIYRAVYKIDEGQWESQIASGRKIYEYIKTNADIKKIKSVLEIGCCTGGNLVSFREGGINECDGIDLGVDYLKFGRDYGLNLMCCSTEGFLCYGKKYDLIILNHVLEHFLNLDIEIKSIKKILNPNGILYISVPGILNIENNAYQGDFLLFLQNAHVRHFSLKTLEQTLNRYGFELILGNEDICSIFKHANKKYEILEDSNRIYNYLCELENKYNKVNIYNVDPRDRNIEILLSFLDVKKYGKELKEYFVSNNYKSIAIYGCGLIGKLVFDELKNSNEVEIKYFIDRNSKKRVGGVETYVVEEIEHRSVDVIVIATTYDYFPIYKLISKHANAVPVITLQDMINYLLNER